MDQPGDRREPPAGGEPARARRGSRALCSGRRMLDRCGVLAAAVLEQRGEVRHHRRDQRPARCRSRTESSTLRLTRPSLPRRRCGAEPRGDGDREAEVRQALAIVLSAWSGCGAPRTRSGRRGAALARSSRRQSSGAASSAASAARSRLQVRQKLPSAALVQVVGQRRPARRRCWLTETPQRSQVHLLAGGGGGSCGHLGCGCRRRRGAARALRLPWRRCAPAARRAVRRGAWSNSLARPRSPAIRRTSSAWSARTKLIPVPRCAGAAGAADPVHVGVAVLGGVEVDRRG